jgi:ring-1,2-phenylacetyl-CoA epoxidase subunit PaaE
MSIPQFHSLTVQRVTPQAAGAVSVTLAVPHDLRARFDFKPGQFLTLRASIDGQPVRRSYSICSSTQLLADAQAIEVGIKPVAGGVFSNWACQSLQVGHTLDVMPPDGRFCSRLPSGTGPHRVGFAAGSGITPILSMIESGLRTDPSARFTLVYGNQKVDSILFNERLQDLKDSYPARLSLIHVLSRQSQDVPLLNGRLDAAKVTELLQTLLPVADIDEVFICGPEGMIDSTEQTLLAAGLAKEKIHTERFVSAGLTAPSSPREANTAAASAPSEAAPVSLDVVIDGKTHSMGMQTTDKLLDVALAAGLDLPYSCKGGVCCTCRGRILEGRVAMEKNFTLEKWEVDKGFVLTCQARPLTPRVVVSYDER